MVYLKKYRFYSQNGRFHLSCSETIKLDSRPGRDAGSMFDDQANYDILWKSQSIRFTEMIVFIPWKCLREILSNNFLSGSSVAASPAWAKTLKYTVLSF